MNLVRPQLIKEIDKYATETLGIPARELMRRSGKAVSDAIRARLLPGKRIVILAGKGNNGGDGYAAASMLLSDFDVIVYDVFSSGQRSDEGKYFLSKYIQTGGTVLNYSNTPEALLNIKSCDCIVDAIFGTGFISEVSREILEISECINSSDSPLKVSVDVPLGINAENGNIADYAVRFDITVALSFIKRGTVSYPAREYAGEIIYSDIGLPTLEIAEKFSVKDAFIDEKWFKEKLPKRAQNSNKGSFGKLLVIAGSEKYRGAAHLALESALRSGVGLVTFMGENELINKLVPKFPEVIYEKTREIENSSSNDINHIVEFSKKFSSILIGSGSGNTKGLLDLVLAFLVTPGAPIIIDADAINALSTLAKEGLNAIKNARRKVILTPHPLEFSRLIGIGVDEIQKNRINYAESAAKELGAVIVLKGAGTLIANEDAIYVNSNGSSALAKAGSGDVLAGVMASFVAQNPQNLFDAAALSVYLHASAGDNLALSLSEFGVTPSDLPKEIARVLAHLCAT